MPKIIGGCIVFRGQKFVLVKQRRLSEDKGKWSFPGGNLNRDESIIDAAKREVKEETNLNIIIKGLVGIYKQNDLLIYIFKASATNGNLKYPKDELMDARWFTIKEFSKLKDSELRGILMRQAIKDCNKVK